jgi:hypothetical protein
MLSALCAVLCAGTPTLYGLAMVNNPIVALSVVDPTSGNVKVVGPPIADVELGMSQIPRESSLLRANALQLLHDLSRPSASCRGQLRRLGTKGDGGYVVCNELPQLSGPEFLVYSFDPRAVPVRESAEPKWLRRAWLRSNGIIAARYAFPLPQARLEQQIGDSAQVGPSGNAVSDCSRQWPRGTSADLAQVRH